MKKVKGTKNPTVKQLQDIARNLKEHLNTYVVASTNAKCFDHLDDIFVEYGIYIASDGQATHIFKTWQELLSFYHKLMEEDLNE